MIEQTWNLRWRPSIFSKLLAIMLGMVIVLVIIVSAFFKLMMFPATMVQSEHAAQEYARMVAERSPDLEAAKKIYKQTRLNIRYEGPDGSWTTSDSLPQIEQVRNGQARSSPGREFYVEVAPNGGTYLVVWDVRSQFQATHEKLLWMLLLLIVGVVLAAYWFQKQLLRPVRSLGDGVARMSAGQLDIVLPVFAHDELGLLTTAFNQMVRRVKEMIQSRDQLLLDVSHELRSPLTRMKIGLALMPEDENKASLDSDIREMEIMISELLELERLRAPHGTHKNQQDLVKILHQVAEPFEKRSPGIRVSANSPSILLDMDGNKIHVLLRNLLENACKYSLPDSRPVDLYAFEDQQSVIVTVRDDGQGIPETHITNIFEPFFRLDPSRSKKTGGYGLGLSICKRIAEAHGGTIQAENNPGRGSLFTVTIPKATSSPQSREFRFSGTEQQTQPDYLPPKQKIGTE